MLGTLNAQSACNTRTEQLNFAALSSHFNPDFSRAQLVVE
jgi:hypothetical protein